MNYIIEHISLCRVCHSKSNPVTSTKHLYLSSPFDAHFQIQETLQSLSNDFYLNAFHVPLFPEEDTHKSAKERAIFSCYTT